MDVIAGNYDKLRRDELASFLRNRRARVTPGQVGLAPGPRRRTPGLRREEVAQLAGVGVTWYTWLEQGRPINASVQVLDAIAGVLRLGPTERWHLYRLAELPGVPTPRGNEVLPGDVLTIIDALEPNPACVYNGRYDLLACNESYAALFPGLVNATGIERNALWQMYGRAGESPIQDEEVCGAMIAQLRVHYASHVGEPEWVDLIQSLSAASPEFAALWAEHRITEPGPPLTKAFKCFGLGTVRVRASTFALPGHGECRMVTYVPVAAEDIALIAELRKRMNRGQLRPA